MSKHDKDDTPVLPEHRFRGENVEERGNGLASGLQPGGTIPGGGPAAMEGSIGTGGGSDNDRPTGDAAKNNIDEDVG
jgi:hypothetical protein